MSVSVGDKVSFESGGSQVRGRVTHSPAEQVVNGQVTPLPGKVAVATAQGVVVVDEASLTRVLGRGDYVKFRMANPQDGWPAVEHIGRVEHTPAVALVNKRPTELPGQVQVHYMTDASGRCDTAVVPEAELELVLANPDVHHPLPADVVKRLDPDHPLAQPARG